MKRSLVYIISAILIVISIIFSLLIKVWGGFSYFVLTTLTALSLMWGIHLILLYIREFKKQLEENFVFFKADTINNTNITSQYFDENIAEYKKVYNKKVFKDKFFYICKIVLCFGIAALFFVGMFAM